MRYLLPLLFAFTLFSCDEPDPVTGDEPRNPLIDSAEYYNVLSQEARKGNVFTASVYADFGLAYSMKADYDWGIANGWANKGYAQFELEEYSEARTSLRTAIDLYSSFGDSTSIANCSYDLCNVYLATQQYDSAMIYGQRALKLHGAENLHGEIYNDLNSIGLIYNETQNFDSAISVFKRRVDLERHFGDSLSTAQALSDLAGAYVASGDAETGLAYRQMALNKLSDPSLDSTSVEILLFKSRLLNKLAGDYFLQNDAGKAIKSGQEALAIAARINWRDEKRAALKTLAELYGLAGREDVQLQLIEQYILLNDSLLKEEMQSRDYAIDFRCNHVEQQLIAAELAAKAASDALIVQEEESDKRLMLMWILISTLLIVTLGAVLYARKQSR